MSVMWTADDRPPGGTPEAGNKNRNPHTRKETDPMRSTVTLAAGATIAVLLGTAVAIIAAANNTTARLASAVFLTVCALVAIATAFLDARKPR